MEFKTLIEIWKMNKKELNQYIEDIYSTYKYQATPKSYILSTTKEYTDNNQQSISVDTYYRENFKQVIQKHIDDVYYVFSIDANHSDLDIIQAYSDYVDFYLNYFQIYIQRKSGNNLLLKNIQYIDNDTSLTKQDIDWIKHSGYYAS